MRTILALTCCLALTAAVRAEDQTDKNKTKTTTKAVKSVGTANTHVQGTHLHTHTNTNTLPAVQSNTGVHANKFHSNTTIQSNNSNNGQWKNKNWSKTNTGVQSNTQLNSNVNVNSNVNKGQWKNKNWSKNNQGLGQGNHSFHTQQFHLKNGPNSGIASVKFNQNYKIQGSQNWKGQKYWAFKNYHSQWHDQGWWHNHHNKIILISGGYYYWDNGYYYPAWGYDSANEYYPYDGPIYSYNDMTPDQVTANVQSALQAQGLYQGEIDGLIGPQTRAALAQYQEANGLEPTSAIDQPTVESLLGNS
jgi:peptidoglycan hydrolase-like protein with peptidoglycan-binding domain